MSQLALKCQEFIKKRKVYWIFVVVEFIAPNGAGAG
jgi:hypothetical protein